jgi:CRP/FNR family transcriptional regulator
MIDFDEIVYCDKCDKKCLAKFLQKEDISVLDQNKAVVTFSSGQVILKQATFASKIIYIYSGIIKIVKEGKNGNNTLIKLVDENNFLLLPVHENQRKNPYTAIALTEVKVCEINEALVRNSLANNQRVYHQLLDDYYSDQLFLMNRLHIITTRNSHGKLAASLIYLNSFNKNGFSIFETITRKELAELSSISLESVNKILQEFKNDKIITVNAKGFNIEKLDLVEKLSMIG